LPFLPSHWVNQIKSLAEKKIFIFGPTKCFKKDVAFGCFYFNVLCLEADTRV
jgi:hypothetical protein